MYSHIVSKIPTHVEIFVDMASVVVPLSVYEYTPLVVPLPSYDAVFSYVDVYI